MPSPLPLPPGLAAATPQPGDLVQLPPEDGLGTGVFLVTGVFSPPRDLGPGDAGPRDLQVMDLNGSLWPAHSHGARVVSRPESP